MKKYERVDNMQRDREKEWETDSDTTRIGLSAKCLGQHLCKMVLCPPQHDFRSSVTVKPLDISIQRICTNKQHSFFLLRAIRMFTKSLIRSLLSSCHEKSVSKTCPCQKLQTSPHFSYIIKEMSDDFKGIFFSWIWAVNVCILFFTIIKV